MSRSRRSYFFALWKIRELVKNQKSQSGRCFRKIDTFGKTFWQSPFPFSLSKSVFGTNFKKFRNDFEFRFHEIEVRKNTAFYAYKLEDISQHEINDALVRKIVMKKQTKLFFIAFNFSTLGELFSSFRYHCVVLSK